MAWEGCVRTLGNAVTLALRSLVMGGISGICRAGTSPPEVRCGNRRGSGLIAGGGYSPDTRFAGTTRADAVAVPSARDDDGKGWTGAGGA